LSVTGNVDPTSIAESANVSIIRNQSDSAVTNSSYYTPYDMEIKDELNDAFHKLNKVRTSYIISSTGYLCPLIY